MSVTIKINNTGAKAESIINMLKVLAVDYDFIQVYEDVEELPELSLSEYEKRYKYTIRHIEEGLSVNEMDNKLYLDEDV